MMLVRETYVNETRGAMIGESEFYEPWTSNRGRVFRDYQKEYGRCISRMYIDVAGQEPRAIGWVFGRRERYEDARGKDRERDYYQLEVWVEVRDIPETEDGA